MTHTKRGNDKSGAPNNCMITVQLLANKATAITNELWQSISEANPSDGS